MSGSDPTGFSWLSDILNGNSSSGWEGSTFFGAALGVVGGAYITSLAQAGAFAQGGSLSGFTGTSGLGGGAAIVEAFAGLNDPGANETYAAPTGQLSQGGLYNENAGAAPPGAQGGMACYPACSLNPRAEFATEEQWEAYANAYEVVGNVILATDAAASLGRWLLARAAAKATAAALTPPRLTRTSRASMGRCSDTCFPADLAELVSGQAPVRQPTRR